MAKVVVKNDILEMTVEATGMLHAYDTLCGRLWHIGATLNANTPVDRIRFRHTGPDPVHYEFSIKLKDNREWKQDFWFDVPTDPIRTFDVVPGWRASESALHRALQDLIVIEYSHVGLTEIDMKFV